MRELDTRELATVSGGGAGNNESTHEAIIGGMLKGAAKGAVAVGSAGAIVAGPAGAVIGAGLGAGVGAIGGALSGFADSHAPDGGEQQASGN